VLTGVEEKARSGRSDVMNEPIIEDMVGGESSEISWYALDTWFHEQALQEDSGKRPHLTVAPAANSAAQHTLRNT